MYVFPTPIRIHQSMVWWISGLSTMHACTAFPNLSFSFAFNSSSELEEILYMYARNVQHALALAARKLPQNLGAMLHVAWHSHAIVSRCFTLRSTSCWTSSWVGRGHSGDCIRVRHCQSTTCLPEFAWHATSVSESVIISRQSECVCVWVRMKQWSGTRTRLVRQKISWIIHSIGSCELVLVR